MASKNIDLFDEEAQQESTNTDRFSNFFSRSNQQPVDLLADCTPFQCEGGVSLIDKDEAECLNTWVMPCDSSSLTGIMKSDLSIDFMPSFSTDSWFQSLDTPNDMSHPYPSRSTGSSTSSDTSRESSIPSISYIAKALKQSPADDAFSIVENLLHSSSCSSSILSESDRASFDSVVSAGTTGRKQEQSSSILQHGKLVMNVTAGVAMTSVIEVPNGIMKFHVLSLPIKDVDIKLTSTGNSLTFNVRAQFVGQKIIEIKGEAVNNSANCMFYLILKSSKNKVTFDPPEKIFFGTNSKEKDQMLKRPLTIHNGNDCILLLKFTVNDSKDFRYFLGTSSQKEIWIDVSPQEQYSIDVYGIHQPESYCSNKEAKIDVYLGCPPELSPHLVKLQTIQLKEINYFLPHSQIKAKELQIQSTANCLIWGCVGLDKFSLRTFTLKNVGNHEENLILQFTEKNAPSSFKFGLNNELSSTLKLTLKPMATQEIIVNFSPKSSAQVVNSIIIRRDSNDTVKKIIPLYAYGGKAKILVTNIACDIERESKKVVINADLTSVFNIENKGDGESFFYLETDTFDSSVLKVSPNMGLLKSGMSAAIKIEIVPKPNSFDLVLDKEDIEIVISTLVIVHGDEITRRRLKRLYAKFHKTHSAEFSPFLTDLKKVFSIASDEEGNIKLKDPLLSLTTLYKDGIKKWKLDVVVNRNILESFKKRNSTQQFLELDATLMAEETMIQMENLTLK